MAITIKHAKTDTIADWTQADLDAQIAAGNYPPGTTLADIVLPSDWNNNHTIVGNIVSSITSTDGSIIVTGTSDIDLAVATAGSTQNVLCQVRNTTGATLTKGTVVYISGATGQLPTITKAIATGDATSAQTLGMISADLANNTNGYVTIIGLINDIDTSAYTDGQQLYLSGTTAGAVTATKPQAPTHLVYVAVVEYANPVHGKLFVKVQNGYELNEIHDVQITSPANGQTIIYDATNALWKNANLTAGTGISITNGAASITVTNSSPDQAVVLTPVAPITVTGTYPNFTLGITQSGAASNGYLSSTDWNTFNSKGNGTVTSVSWTGGIVSVATATTTPAFTVAGTSGGIPYFSSASTWASSAVLASNALMIGGGAGLAPSTITTGTGVTTALGVNTGTAGAFVVNGGALGTPSSGTVTNLTGTASININGTVGATTPTTGSFTTLAASSTVSGTGFSTYLASPPAIGGTTAASGSFTTLAATSTVDTSALARASGLSANTTVTNTATFTTAGLTLANQTAAAGTTWRVRAYGQFTAASSATARTAQIACFWGATQLVAITPTVLASTAQTTQWQVEFELVGTSTTAIWTTGSLIDRIASATAIAVDNATPASTTVTAGAQTLDLRVRVSTAVAAESWIIQQVTMERLK